MIILGINAWHGDSAAAILVDGQLMAAVEEERLCRIKHWAGFPARAIGYCLEEVGATLAEVDHIAIGRDPKAHLMDKALFALKKRPTFKAIRDRLANMGRVRDLKTILAEAFEMDPQAITAPIHHVEHHRAHMASAFYPSGFDHAACLTLDGFGDFVSAMWGEGSRDGLTTHGQVLFPHSMGLFYTAVTQFLGFHKYGDEFKIMGLAPYGEGEFIEKLRTILCLDPDGFHLDLDCFLHHSEGVEMVWDGGAPVMGPVFTEKWETLFGPPRKSGSPLTDRERNLAFSVQAVTEEAIFHMASLAMEKANSTNLCLAGGCAFNSVANGKMRHHTQAQNVAIHPAAGDAGTAVGAALEVWHSQLKQPGRGTIDHAYWGPSYSSERMKKALEEAGLKACRMTESQLIEKAVKAIREGKVMGWYQGRSEWGPRALGNRSILADPRRKDMKDILNARIKFREPFRPFAPVILQERTGDFFEDDRPVPFMLQVYTIRPEMREKIPAVAHVDGTGRLQTVTEKENERYYRLIHAFGEATGIPVLLNTSFNENEPIVDTPEQAVDCFKRTKMDCLALGLFWVEKESDVGSEGTR